MTVKKMKALNKTAGECITHYPIIKQVPVKCIDSLQVKNLCTTVMCQQFYTKIKQFKCVHILQLEYP